MLRMRTRFIACTLFVFGAVGTAVSQPTQAELEAVKTAESKVTAAETALKAEQEKLNAAKKLVADKKGSALIAPMTKKDFDEAVAAEVAKQLKAALPARKTTPLYDRIESQLMRAAHEGYNDYRAGRYDAAYQCYRIALKDIQPDLAEIEKLDGGKGLVERVKRALLDAHLESTSWKRVVLLRTAINDIRNVPLRFTDDEMARKTLIERIGGDYALRMVVKKAISTASTDSRVLFESDGEYPFTQFITLELIRGGTVVRGVVPVDYYTTRPAYYYSGISTGQIEAVGRHLRLSLRDYCVPDPEVEQFMKLMRGLGHYQFEP